MDPLVDLAAAMGPLSCVPNFLVLVLGSGDGIDKLLLLCGSSKLVGNLYVYVYIFTYACVRACVCMCLCEREERDRDDRQTDKK